MKRTQWKDAVRNILKRKVSYLSICIICALGVATYLGITYSGEALKESGNQYYSEHNSADIEMVATLGIAEDDVKAVCSVDGVEDAEGAYATSGQLSNRNIHKDVTVISHTERLNQVELVSGRLPEGAKECALEQALLKTMNYKVGDTIRLGSSSGGAASYLKGEEYVITGTFIHPDHITNSIYGNPYVMLDASAFDTEQTYDGFMKLYVKLKQSSQHSVFTDEYFDSIKSVEDNLEKLSVERASIRDDEIRERAQKIISEKEEELKQAKKKLDQAKKELAAGKKRLDEGKKQLDEGKQKLLEGKKQLKEGKRKLKKARKQLDEGKKQLDGGKKKLESADKAAKKTVLKMLQKANKEWKERFLKKEPEATRKKAEKYYDILVKRLKKYDFSKKIEENINAASKDKKVVAQYEKVSAQSQKVPEKYQEVLTKYKNRLLNQIQTNKYVIKYRKDLDELSKFHGEWEKKNEEYQKGEKEYKEKLEEYKKGKKKYQKAKRLYEEKEAEYERGLKKYNKNYKLYKENWKKYQDGLSQLEAEKRKIDNMDKCKWFQFGKKANAGYVDLSMNAENLSSLAVSFALLFVLVGAMVCYATIGRIVNEQRSLLGGMKALGFTNGEIFAKYLFFGMSGTVSGVILGWLLAYFVLQSQILRGYEFLYVFGRADMIIIPQNTILVIVAGILLTLAATYAACSRLLRTPVIQLMKDEIPVQKKENGHQGKGIMGKFSLYSRLIFRNMWMDKKRVMTTIIGVAGCSALLVIGFSLKFSVDGVPDIQYGEIVNFDRKVSFNPEAAPEVKEKISQILEESGAESMPLYDALATCSVKDEQNMVEILCGDLKELQKFYTLLDVDSDEPVELPEKGVLIQKRMAEVYDLKAGDTIALYDSEGAAKTAVVAGVFNNYAGRTMVMPKEYYKEVFGTDCQENCFYVKLQGSDEGALREKLVGTEGYMSYERSDSSRSMFETVSNTLNSVILLLIFMAAVMALVVLLNLAAMYVSQKKTELVIMRINGFTLRETIEYIVRETVFTTFLGLVVGVTAGSGLAYKIIRGLEKPHLQLVRNVSFKAWVIGIAITIVFSLFVNSVALRKVKHFKLTDI